MWDKQGAQGSGSPIAGSFLPFQSLSIHFIRTQPSIPPTSVQTGGFFCPKGGWFPVWATVGPHQGSCRSGWTRLSSGRTTRRARSRPGCAWRGFGCFRTRSWASLDANDLGLSYLQQSAKNRIDPTDDGVHPLVHPWSAPWASLFTVSSRRSDWFGAGPTSSAPVRQVRRPTPEAAREPAAFKPLQTWTRLRPREPLDAEDAEVSFKLRGLRNGCT